MQHRVAVIMVVFDDGGYGNVRRSQELRFGNRVHVSNLTNPDFVKLSQSFGIKARTVDSAAELQRVLAAFVTAEEPALIHVPVGPMPDPWKFVDQPRVRG
jgi:acetolactate synthase-1/2/3 large subunit